MNWRADIPLDGRDPDAILEQILARRLGYVPEWNPSRVSAAAGLARITARYLHVVLQRLNQAPEKNKLAFLDALGLQLVPAQASRVPIVFQLSADAMAGAAPAGSAAAAPPPPEGTTQVVFETERAIGIAAGKIAQVFTLWPGRDEYIDHSEAFEKGTPIRLYDKALRKATPHRLYLAHDTLLALAGNVEVLVDFELTQPSGEHLDILWEYWDGEVWREFLNMNPACTTDKQDKLDSTEGLTKSGRYVLKTDCAESSKTEVDGVGGSWIRGRLTEPLPPDSTKFLPEVDRIRLSSAVNQPLRPRLTASIADRPPGKRVQHPLVASAVLVTEAGVRLAGANLRLTDANDPNLSYPSQPGIADGEYTFAGAAADTDYDLQVIFQGFSASVRVSLSAAEPALDLLWTMEGLAPDKAYADGAELDVTKPFYPLGQQPTPGTTFYFANEEILSKPGAQFQIYFSKTESSLEQTGFSSGAVLGTGQPGTPLDHSLHWEYWNGRAWVLLARSREKTAAAGPVISHALAYYSSLPGSSAPRTPGLRSALLDFTETEVVDLIVPDDIEPVEVNDEQALWIRARLVRGGYGVHQKVSWNASGTTNYFHYVIPNPPVLADFRMGYSWIHGPFPAEQVKTYNDFHHQDHTADARWPGNSFKPFRRMEDVTPALYLGLEKKPPVDRIGMYFDIEEQPEESKGPALDWEYWDGLAWRLLSVEDETAQLRRPGLAAFIGANDSHTLPRFGKDLHWVRARLKEDGPPGDPLLNAIYLNAVWASQHQSFRNVPLGASSGLPNQLFQVTQIPVLEGERLEVRELAGPRANVEWRILAAEIFKGDTQKVRSLELRLGEEGSETDFTEGDLRLRRDRNKKVAEAWVRWDGRRHLFFSEPDDRHYALDRAQGQVVFGDGENAKIPPIGANITLAEFRAGGGAAGNVAAKTVTQLLGPLAGVEAVFNPRPAEGGADGETMGRFAERGPRSVRHRGRAVAAADYETLAREASPAVGFARVMPTRNRSGRPAPGWITVIVIPESGEPRPWPSAGLRDRVRRFLERHAPADLAACAGIYVTGPDYLPVDVAATIVPVDFSQAGVVERRARQALQKFFHPLHGGPGSRGWSLGRDPHRSDVAAVLEGVEGVDYLDELALLRHGTPQGERVAVSWDRIVVAGKIDLKAAGK